MLEVCCAVANLEGLWARTSGWARNELEEWLFGLYLDAHARYPRTGHLLLPYPSNRRRSAAQKWKSFFFITTRATVIRSLFDQRYREHHLMISRSLLPTTSRLTTTPHSTLELRQQRYRLHHHPAFTKTKLFICVRLARTAVSKVTFILFLKT